MPFNAADRNERELTPVGALAEIFRGWKWYCH
jgi:hypothetical protein